VRPVAVDLGERSCRRQAGRRRCDGQLARPISPLRSLPIDRENPRLRRAGVGGPGRADRGLGQGSHHTLGGPDETEFAPGAAAIDERMLAVVAKGVFGLLAEASQRLLESVEHSATRAHVVDQLTEVLAELK
jgi:hypothetical protein